MTDRKSVADRAYADEGGAKPVRAAEYRSPVRLEITRGRVLSPWRRQAYGADPQQPYRSGSLFASLGGRSTTS